MRCSNLEPPESNYFPAAQKNVVESHALQYIYGFGSKKI
jgi:hypothetical protein